MFSLWERMKIVVEPTGALAAAGAYSAAAQREELRGKRVGVVISGGNIDIADVPRFRAIAGF
jgi:threonine dehydratase